jgi:hypothetical protein
MSNLNIFQNDTKTVPKSDSQIVRVSMQENEIAARKGHVPTPSAATASVNAITHVPNAGTNR